MPIRLPLVCAIRDEQVEIIFRQPITCAALGLSMLNTDIKFERFNPGVNRFVTYPRPHQKLYVEPGEHLVYRAADVNDCPGAADLAAGRPFQPQLPAFLNHVLAQKMSSNSNATIGLRAASSASPALSSASALADDFDIKVASPARVLRSGLILPPAPDSPSTSISRVRASPSLNKRRANTEGTDTSVSKGVKRKRSEPEAKAQKRTRTRGRSPEAGDFGEVWEIYDYNCIMLWAL